MKERIWTCKIGASDAVLSSGADQIMRAAVGLQFKELTGKDPEFCFSGWGGELTECEHAVVENRMPVPEPALRIVKRQDGHWLYIEAGGLEAMILLREFALDPLSIVDRAIAAAAIAEILPAPSRGREHVTDGGPCWCGPVVEGAVFKHNIGAVHG